MYLHMAYIKTREFNTKKSKRNHKATDNFTNTQSEELLPDSLFINHYIIFFKDPPRKCLPSDENNKILFKSYLFWQII